MADIRETLTLQSHVVTKYIMEALQGLPPKVSPLAKFTGALSATAGQAMSLVAAQKDPELRSQLALYYTTQLKATSDVLEKLGKGEQVDLS